MKKDVLVTVSGLQMTPDGDDTIEITTSGKYYEKDGVRYVFYDEVGDDTQFIVKNTIEIGPHKVEVRKKGIISAQMCFEEQKKLTSLYSTPYGQMELGIFTRGIHIKDDPDRVKLELDYRLDINNEHVSDSRISLCIESSL